MVVLARRGARELHRLKSEILSVFVLLHLLHRWLLKAFQPSYAASGLEE